MVPKEQIAQWLKTGFNSTAVLGVGMSAESANKLLLTGEIPYHCPCPDMIPYQQKLVGIGSGRFLYYTYPFLDRFAQFKPKLAQTMVRRLDGDTSSLEENWIKNSLKAYGMGWGIRDAYKERFGVRRYDKSIVTMAGFLFPQMVKERCGENPKLASFMVDVDWDDDHASGLESSNIPLGVLKDILDDCLRRRGVLLFYNDWVFKHRILTNHEDEKDIMILSSVPLTTEVVSGIEPQSGRDKEVMLQGIEL